MKKLEMIMPESYEAPALLDIMPVTIDHVVGDSFNGDPDDQEGSGGGGSNGDDAP